jgi:hypothetical protein
MKKKELIKITVIIGFAGLLTCCKQIYTPDINSEFNALVVDGLITNSSGPYYVKLSQSVPYDSASARLPVSGASVSVTDDDKNSYPFYETGNGVYNSDISFKGIPGKSYTLHIKTQEGDVYESSAQQLPMEPSLDSIHGFSAPKEILIETPGNGSAIQYINGINVLLDLNKQGIGMFPMCRFKSSLFLEYVYVETTPPPFSMPRTFYFWNNFSLDDMENITGSKYSSNSTSILNQSLCFMPTSKNHYNVGDTCFIFHYILFFNEYNLNNETYNYYKGINEQLLSDGKLFDPIASQLNGNIKCINNSRKVALGLFEASSVQTVTYIVQPPAKDNITLFTKINNLITNTGSGVTINVPPYFWVN